MLDIAPLWPLRYRTTSLGEVISPPYDVINPELRKRLGERHPHNVVHIDLPEGEGDAKYQRAKELFEVWQREGVLIREEQPAFFRYTQTFTPPGGGRRITRRGFFAAVRAVPFSDRVVLPHERTLDGPKLDRIRLTRATRAALSPQFMLYSDPGSTLDPLLDAGGPVTELVTDDGIEHHLSPVRDPAAVATIRRTLRDGTLLIADGHHRYETAVAISGEFQAEARAGHAPVNERAEYLFTFAFLANGDDPGLVVFPTHRLVHSLGQFDWDALLSRAGDVFSVSAHTGSIENLLARLAEQKSPAVAAVASGGRAALLVLRPEARLAEHPVLSHRPEVLRATDVVLLHDGILEHILGISPDAQAKKTNLRYLQEPRAGLEVLDRGQGQVLFLMNATDVATVRRVAEAGEVMPQKSTFFYPKVPTGLFFHTLYAERSIP